MDVDPVDVDPVVVDPVDVDEVGLQVRYRPSVAWRSTVWSCVLLGVVGVAWWSGLVPDALLIVLTTVSVVLTAVLVVALVAFARRVAKNPLALRLDVHGVTFGGCPTVPWSGVAVVEVTPWKPTMLRRTRLVVAFLPRPGVTFPETTEPPGARGRLARRLYERRYGTCFVLPAFMTDASAAEVAEAAGRLGGVSVVGRPAGAAYAREP